MTALRSLVVMAAAIVVVCILQGCQTYRECRQHYKFERAFCAGMLLP